MARIKLVMTRGKDDAPDLYKMLGTKADRKELDRQFKSSKSNFKIAIVVDMWLTGFDVPFPGHHVYRQTGSTPQPDSDHLQGEPQIPSQGKGIDRRLYRHQETDEPGPGPLCQEQTPPISKTSSSPLAW